MPSQVYTVFGAKNGLFFFFCPKQPYNPFKTAMMELRKTDGICHNQLDLLVILFGKMHYEGFFDPVLHFQCFV